MQPYQNLNVIKKIASYAGEEAKLEWIQFYLGKGFTAIEKILEKSSGKYCIGDDISLADLCLVPQVYSANRFNVDMSLYPNAMRVYKQLEECDAFKRAHAHRQPDTIPELREN
jgi:maleylacetoacetate isomerase